MTLCFSYCVNLHNLLIRQLVCDMDAILGELVPVIVGYVGHQCYVMKEPVGQSWEKGFYSVSQVVDVLKCLTCPYVWRPEWNNTHSEKKTTHMELSLDTNSNGCYK
jgi:hypothetical protein